MDDKSYRKTKTMFLFQSFMPIFILLCIKYFDARYVQLMNVLNDGKIWKMIIFIFSVVWTIISCLYIYVFKNIQTYNFRSMGEKIEKIEYNDSPDTLFFIFYLMLLIVDVNGLQTFLLFCGTFLLEIIVVYRSNILYRNPLLTILGYKTFLFKTNTGIKGIGITHGQRIDVDKIIKRKQITEDVYFVYNEK